MFILLLIYVIAALLLAFYAFNTWVLTFLFLKHRARGVTAPALDEDDLPSVTVQLPIFNEALVVERLIDAVVCLNYPSQQLQIQVLDDSTDDTTLIAQARVDLYRQQGVNIQLLHRTDRTGFKAGALKNGLDAATGELVVIFDADFVPTPNFLRQTVAYFSQDDRLGFIQTRWEHLNRNYSWLTAAQALALDGHFVVEQTARNRAGLLINFNGTAGVWRRQCIEAAGGWQGDTISEDFDLSYRAQLRGWRCLFLSEVAAPAEVPPQLAAFKRQQFRWAKGSIQCFKKLGWQVCRSPLAWAVKIEALLHLSNYLVHPLMVILALITPILIMTGAAKIHFPLIYLSLVSLGPPLLYAVAQINLFPRHWRHHYKAMPLLMLIGSGIALSNTQAVIEAFLGIGNIFRRTPKFNIHSSSDRWQNSIYRLPLDRLTLAELALGLYSFFGAWMAVVNGHQFAAPFILLYAFGFSYVGGQSLWDARRDLWNWLTYRSNRQEPSDPPKRSRLKRSKAQIFNSQR